MARRKIKPDLILTDFNLPNGMDGLQLARKVQQAQRRVIPVVILTGDISTRALREITAEHSVQLNKPVKLEELTQAIQRLLPSSPASHEHSTEAPNATGPVIFVVDDDAHVRNGIRAVLEDDGRLVEDYPTCEAFLEAYRPGGEACLLIDGYLPGMTGLELLKRLGNAGHQLPAIMITGSSDVPMAVQAMKAGASDFIEKPIAGPELLASIDLALEHARDSHKLDAWKDSATTHLAGLTSRQRQIMDMVLAGHPSKNIAADLGISQRTVENHRAAIMKKSGSKSLPALARLALAAAWRDADVPRV
jgi:two-component system CheB/CheR fusion protein